MSDTDDMPIFDEKFTFKFDELTDQMNLKVWDNDFIGSDFMGKTINFTVGHLIDMSKNNYTYGPALYYDGRDGVHSRQRVGTALLRAVKVDGQEVTLATSQNFVYQKLENTTSEYWLFGMICALILLSLYKMFANRTLDKEATMERPKNHTSQLIPSKDDDYVKV